MKKGLFFLLVVIGLLFVSSALAQAPGMGTSIKNAWNTILDWGSLSFLFGTSVDNHLIGFLRILIGVLVFSLLFAASAVIPGISRNIAITICIILTIMTSIFFPASVLMMLGETYTTIFAFLILGAPLLGVGWLLFGTPTPSRGWAFAKFLGICLLIYLFAQISHWAGILGGMSSIP
ncbi:hypothetical protein HZC32_02370 [Candidatus Woesearchaeota archaeon]|nr:hypothetical protein [Candidatus Woesearchaeota archaeon]